MPQLEQLSRAQGHDSLIVTPEEAGVTDGNFGGTVESVLLELASQGATGALTITGPDAEQSVVWFRDGLVYSVSVPGRRPLLGVRLMSSGSLTPESLAEALEVQRTELQGWRLGELLVHLGFVDRAVVEAFVLEQVHDQVADLIHWRVSAHRFRNGQRTRQDVAPPAEVTELLDEARQRDERWAAIAETVGGADGVPVLSASESAASDVVLGPYDWALLCKVDGVRSIADLADDCGFTVYEAGMVVEGLIAAGLVEVEPLGYDLEPVPSTDDEEMDVAASVARVTAALTDMLGTGTTPSGSAAGRRSSPFGAPPSFEDAPEAGLAEVVSLQQERADRDAAVAIREDEAQRAKARLDAAAQEAAERAEDERLEAEARAEAEREEAERVAEQEAAEATERAAAEQQREKRKAEKAREREERARNEARAATERRQRERAEREQARLEAERLEEEQLEVAARERAEREEAERVAAEQAEADRLAAEQAEADRIAAEEEAARLEAERIAAEQAEAERIAAEEEAARLEADRLATEQAEIDRIAAEEAAARYETALAQPVPGLAPLDRPGFAALLSEFDRDSAAAAAIQATEPGPAPEPDPEPEDEPAAPDLEPEPALVGAPPEQADTAALLRELSSLGGFGMDSPPPASAAPRSAPRKPVPVEQPRRRGGFFRR